MSIGEPSVPTIVVLGPGPVDEIHHVVELAAVPERMQLLAMATARRVLQVPVPPISTALRCWAMKSSLAKSRTSVFDRRAPELEVVEVLGERQPSDGELVLDRARLVPSGGSPKIVITGTIGDGRVAQRQNVSKQATFFRLGK